VFFLYPLAGVLIRSFDAGTLLETWRNPVTTGVLWFTTWQALASTALCLAVALPTAAVLARLRFRGRRLVHALLVVPFVLPTVVVAAAFLSLMDRFGATDRFHHTVWAILAAHVFFNYAVIARSVAAYWSQLDPAPEQAAAGVSAVWPGALRGEVRRLGALTLLVDCYNSNPAGVRAAALALLLIGDEGRWVVVLGTMLELGERSAEIHRDTLAAILQLDLDLYILTGAFARAARDFADDRIAVAEELAELAWRLPRMVGPGDKVLLKASRGIRLERVIPALEHRFGRARVR